MTKLTFADRAQWRNIWCILRSMDWYELRGRVNESFDWPLFRDGPQAYLVRTDDHNAKAIWTAVEKRLK